MKCKECNQSIEGELKYIAYISDGKPVYWKICDDCLRKQWLEYKEAVTEK